MHKMYYKKEIEKQASLGGAVLGAAKAVMPMAGKAVGKFTGMSAGKRMATGALVGAGAKGLTYDKSQGGSRLGAMTSGAVQGGILGGLAGKGKGAGNKSTTIPQPGQIANNSAPKISTGGLSGKSLISAPSNPTATPFMNGNLIENVSYKVARTLY